MIALELNAANIIGQKDTVISLIGRKMRTLCGLNILVAAFELYNADPAITIAPEEIDRLVFNIDSGYYNGRTDIYSLFLIETKFRKGYWYFEFRLNNRESREYQCIYLGRDYSAVEERKRHMSKIIQPEYWLF